MVASGTAVHCRHALSLLQRCCTGCRRAADHLRVQSHVGVLVLGFHSLGMLEGMFSDTDLRSFAWHEMKLFALTNTTNESSKRHSAYVCLHFSDAFSVALCFPGTLKPCDVQKVHWLPFPFDCLCKLLLLLLL